MTVLNEKTVFYKYEQLLLENERLRETMRDMIKITKDDALANGIARVAIQKCLKHALENPDSTQTNGTRGAGS